MGMNLSFFLDGLGDDLVLGLLFFWGAEVSLLKVLLAGTFTYWSDLTGKNQLIAFCICDFCLNNIFMKNL